MVKLCCGGGGANEGLKARESAQRIGGKRQSPTIKLKPTVEIPHNGWLVTSRNFKCDCLAIGAASNFAGRAIAGVEAHVA